MLGRGCYNLDPSLIEQVAARRGGLHAYTEIVPARPAFVVIDMQPYFLAEGAPAECAKGREIIGNLHDLARALRQHGGTVVWVRTVATDQSRDGWANLAALYSDAKADQRWTLLAPDHPQSVLWPALQPEPEDWQVLKTRYSAFNPNSADLDDRLRGAGVDTVLIGGVATNICCETSARDAMVSGYRTVMVADVNAAMNDDVHRRSLETFLGYFGDVQNVEEVIGYFV